MPSPKLINSIAKELALPGNVKAAKAFFTTQFEDAPDTESKRRIGRLLDTFDEYEAKEASPKPIPATAQAQPQPDPKASAKTK